MKQQFETKHKSQNQKFNHQLGHLSSVVGLANWQFSSPTPEEMKAYEQKARQLHASESYRLISSALKRITSGVKIASANLISEFKRRQQRRRGIERLQQLNDYMLKDIGISRSDVMALANNKATAEQINAQRLGRRAVLKQKVAKPVQQAARKDTQRFSANDPHHMRECA